MVTPEEIKMRYVLSMGLALAVGLSMPGQAESAKPAVPMNASPECLALRDQEYLAYEQMARRYAESTGSTALVNMIDEQIAQGLTPAERVRVLMGPPAAGSYSYPIEQTRRCTAPDREGRLAEWEAYRQTEGKALREMQCQYTVCGPEEPVTIEIYACGTVWYRDPAWPEFAFKFCE